MVTFLANGAGTFSINGKPIFVNGLRILQRNPPDYMILDILNRINVWLFIDKNIEKQYS